MHQMKKQLSSSSEETERILVLLGKMKKMSVLN